MSAVADQERAGSAPFGFDVNLSAIFTEMPLLDRPQAAARAGFTAVELWWPFSAPVPGEAEQSRLVATLGEAGTRLVACNLYEGNRTAGDRGIISVAGVGSLFADNLAAALQFGCAAGCRTFNALYGNRDLRLTQQRQRELAIERLLVAAQAAAAIGAIIVLEVLNPADNPRYSLTSFRAALDVIQRVAAAGADNVRLLIDLYHAATIGADLDGVLALASGRIGHVQIADAPGRHQPGTGALGVRGLLGPLERAGYDGWVGIEYTPLGPSAASFGWLPRDRRSSRRGSQMLKADAPGRDGQ